MDVQVLSYGYLERFGYGEYFPYKADNGLYRVGLKLGGYGNMIPIGLHFTTPEGATASAKHENDRTKYVVEQYRKGNDGQNAPEGA